MLYLVATPIGNLADVTLRALETLRAVDMIAAEDTRKTGILLNRYDISKPQLAFHEHNEEQAGRKIMELLLAGQSVAVVSEAGTPGISDPGFSIVRRAVEAGIKVTVIPGATAVTTALVLSGLPAHSFTFRGFPPRKPGKRKNFLAVDVHAPHTLVFYESPHRLRAFLQDALEVYGDRQTAVCNELTKLFETIHRGRLSDHIAHFAQEEPRGEYVVVIAGHEYKKDD